MFRNDNIILSVLLTEALLALLSMEIFKQVRVLMLWSSQQKKLTAPFMGWEIRYDMFGNIESLFVLY